MKTNLDDLYQVGAITQTHGIKGDVKVFPMTDDISRFKGMKDLLLYDGKELITLECTKASPQKNLVILHFKGYDDINLVEKYKNCNLYVTKENRVKLKKDEYFAADLIGLKVKTDDGRALGTLTDVISTGANDVYEVTTDENKSILIPAIKECILDVALDVGEMLIHLLAGLE